MKSALLTTALLLAGATTTASAQDEAKNYITGQVLRSDSECEGFRDGVAPLGLTATCDTSDIGFRVAYGRQFTDLFGLEVGYQDAGEGEAVAFAPGAPQTPVVRLEAPLEAFDLVATLGWRLSDEWRVSGRLGAAHYDYEVNTTQAGFGADNSDTTLTYGVGVEWRWLTFGYDVITDVGQENLLAPTAPDIEQDVDRFHVGVIYRF